MLDVINYLIKSYTKWLYFRISCFIWCMKGIWGLKVCSRVTFIREQWKTANIIFVEKKRGRVTSQFLDMLYILSCSFKWCKHYSCVTCPTCPKVALKTPQHKLFRTVLATCSSYQASQRLHNYRFLFRIYIRTKIHND